MSCFPSSPETPAASSLRFEATNSDVVKYVGSWTPEQDSQTTFLVSKTSGDSATFVFTGTFVQVFGRISSQGMNARFGIDKDGGQGGGATCAKASPNDGEVALFESSPLTQDLHTLFITNKGGTISLNLFEVGGAGPSTSQASTVVTPTQSTPSPPTIVPPSLQSTTSSVAFNPSTPTVPNPSSTTQAVPSTTLTPSSKPRLPLPSDPTASPVQSNLSQTATDSTTMGKSDAEKSPSYTVSSYTEVSSVGGSPVTIVIQTTVEVQQTQPYRGLSRGAVAGAVVGSLLFLILLIGLGLWWWRRRRTHVRFLYGISNLDFDPAMMTRSSAAELPSQSVGIRIRDSDATLYMGDTLPPYKRPVSYSSLASQLKKHPPSERAMSGVAGDRRLFAHDEPNPRSLPEERGLCDSRSTSGQGSVESVVPPSEECHEAL